MKLTGGEIIMKSLKREKVPYILGIPGHGVLALFDALRESEAKGDIRYLQVKHEQTAVHMADAYYRMTGQPLATLSSIGPGSLNTIIGLATAYADSSAVLSLCGDTHTNMKGVGVLQELERYQDSNFIRVMEPVVKRSWRVETTEQLPRIMSRAFAQMKNGRSGPIAVSLPMDVQANAIGVDIPEEMPPLVKPAAYAQKEAIDKAIALMKAAKRPVILVGGAALRTHAAEKLVALAEKWNAAVITTLAGKSAFPEAHPLYGFHTGSKGTPVGLALSSKADVILALGTRFADETTCSYRDKTAFSFPETKLIHVDICSEELGKNYRPDVGIVGDLNCVIDQLTEAYGEPTKRSEYCAEILSLKKDWFDYLEQYRAASGHELTISQMIGVMSRTLPEDTVIVTSSGNTQAQLFQEYCFKKPYSCLTTGGFSTMGWAVPAAMGAKLACPDRPVVAFVGDGDFMMTMQELSTMVQYDIPVIVILANNCGWHAIKDLQIDAYGKEAAFGNDFLKGGEAYSPDFAHIAEGFGMKAWEAADQVEVEAAIKEALELKKPAMIVAQVSRNHPYTGGKAFGWWDVPVPTYMEERRQAYEAGKKEEHWSL